CDNLIECLKTIKCSSNTILSKIIKDRIKPNKNLKKFNANVNAYFEKENEIKAEINIKAITQGNIDINDEFSFKIKTKPIICEKCSKQNTEYFEAILQIRNKNENIIQDVLKDLDLILEEEKKRSVFATKIESLKNGVDIYITSQKHIKTIGKKLYEIYGGEMKINEKLFSKDHLTSKNLYRVNVLLSIPDFKKGSLIKINDQLIFISSIKGNFILGKDLIKNKNIKTKYNFDEIEIIQLKPHKTNIIKTHPEIEVLNPLTYQNEKIMNNEIIKEKNIDLNNNVDIVIYNNSIWIV
ncbi:MAG: NMD3-related protein, partial [Candidatus Woesearchaeota archaeon]